MAWPDSYTSFDINYSDPYDVVQSLEDIKSGLQKTSNDLVQLAEVSGLTQEQNNKLMSLPSYDDISTIIRNVLINVNFGKLVIDKKSNKMFTYDKQDILISEHSLYDDLGRPSTTKVYKREVVK